MSYFGPLSQEYCAYFYLLSVLCGVLFVISIIGIIYAIISSPKKVDSHFLVTSMTLSLNVFFMYFVNRLLNTMCVNST